MDPLIQNLIGTAIRWLLTFVAGWLVTAGILTSGTQTEWIAGLTAGLVALVWGIYQKYVAHHLLKTALKLPAGASMAEAQATAKNQG